VDVVEADVVEADVVEVDDVCVVVVDVDELVEENVEITM
jgi:hypothetical protein